MATYLLNPNCQVQLIQVGQEKTPVLIIDDFMLGLDQLTANINQSAKFTDANDSNYAGVRAPIDSDYLDSVLPEIVPIFYQVFRVPQQLNLSLKTARYSLLTKDANQLNTLQRWPHFDSYEPGYFAVMHYINEGNFEGTGFYRHRETNKENILNEQQAHDYMLALQNWVDKYGEPEANYTNGGNTVYERIGTIEYKPNRFVIYPGSLLHSPIATHTSHLSDDPQHGRLTANLFINFE
ncbi:hypothetical protein C2869_18510 [Saccharobesus litoralis]|uniref:Uncharacterized protein n=1 Tax=Saccharobesus litoralis TaxID=2172099 RepID=A0A2S0VVS6_9ALTE|nr:DUF6445 family protein [Saccharobesus litoralis]AWB68283.1 hypothetical protein C2869_18510 [Saccharobesus litoralis]